jgi:hypothetical protein
LRVNDALVAEINIEDWRSYQESESYIFVPAVAEAVQYNACVKSIDPLVKPSKTTRMSKSTSLGVQNFSSSEKDHGAPCAPACVKFAGYHCFNRDDACRFLRFRRHAVCVDGLSTRLLVVEPQSLDHKNARGNSGPSFTAKHHWQC